MLRRLSETFTATHFTILALGAMLIPSALYATVSTTAVSITDPNSGAKSLVDAARRLYVYDPVAGNQNYPGNYFYSHFRCSASASNSTYTPPTGKALIVKSIHFYYIDGSSNSSNYMYINNQGLTIAAIQSTMISDSKTVGLGNGYFVRNGETINEACAGGNGIYEATLVGYFVPSNQVPPAT